MDTVHFQAYRDGFCDGFRAASECHCAAQNQVAGSNKALLENYIGKNVFIRTVTMYHVGKLVGVTAKEYALEDASWVADTGKFTEFLKSGRAADIEHFPQKEMIGNRDAIIDFVLWPHELPSYVK